MGRQYVFPFGLGADEVEGGAHMRSVLGAKGAALAAMAAAGLPAPPGFTISTEACAYFVRHNGKWPPGLMEQIREAFARLERATGRTLGDGDNPLLVSLRSGAAVDMPGLMDSLLNLGLTHRAIGGLARATGSERTAWDCYRRLIEAFGPSVAGKESGLARHDFDAERGRLKKKYGVRQETELTASQLQELCQSYERIHREKVGKFFPQDSREQFDMALKAAFAAWNSSRCRNYRQLQRISGLLGTAVSVCAMVFGNAGADSGCGVASSRDAGTGAARPTGRYLVDAQGGDFNASARAPKALDEMAREEGRAWARVHAELQALILKLERHYRYPQEFEFAVERGKLWLLHTRNARRTGMAGIRWAVEMATGRNIENGRTQARILAPRDALLAVSADDLEQMLCPTFAAENLAHAPPLATGRPIVRGTAVGKIMLDAAAVRAGLEKNPRDKLLLVREDLDPEDAGVFPSVQGILTTTGDAASRAPTLSRLWNTCCVVAADALRIDHAARVIRRGDVVVREGDWISLDGSTGAVYAGELRSQTSAVVAAAASGKRAAERKPAFKLFRQISAWSDAFRKMKVRAAVTGPAEAHLACLLGAEGATFCIEEYFRSADERMTQLGAFLRAPDTPAREQAEARLVPPLLRELTSVFVEMKGLPVAIRLLDSSPQRLLAPRRREKDEARLMHGPLSEPWQEIMALQTRCIVDAACAAERLRARVFPEILVPSIVARTEFDFCEALIRKVAEETLRRRKGRVKFAVGAMIEVPRSALTADEIAESAQVFCFNTGMLTRLTFGASRDRMAAMLPDYLAERILPHDPHQTLDAGGVGLLVDWAVRKGRETRPGLACGLWGEHGGDPASVKICCKAGLNYVSCAPLRVPIARLAAAQAAIRS
jgi:pyruvate,orthophosphate dikinase